MKTDWDRVAAELVRVLRGRSTQSALSRRLGFKTNVLYRWESGVRQITGDDFFRILTLRIDNPSAKLWRFSSAPADADGLDAPFAWFRWLQKLRAKQTISDIAGRTDISAQALRRIFRGDTDPSLSRILTLVDALTNRIIEFITVLGDPSQIPSLKTRYDMAVAQRDVAFKHLNAEAIIASIETAGYRALDGHSHEWIAGRLSLPVAEVVETMAALVSAGALRRRGGKYYAQALRNVNTQSASRDAFNVLARHWAENVTARSEDDVRRAYVVFSGDQATFDDIARIMSDGMHRSITRISKSREIKQVGALVVQLARLDSAGETCDS